MQRTFLQFPSKTVFFLLTILFGIIIFYPFHNFQLHLTQGDHGHNLYCFRKTFEGAIPYRDYWWVYGPLMPYYYSLFFHLFGVSIHSVLLGQMILNFICGLLVYRTLSLFVRPFLAFTAAIWYWIFFPPFEHTYNHIGGIFCILWIVYYFFLYIRRPRSRYLYLVLAGVLILALIKLNFGLSMWGGLLLGLWFTDWLLKNPPLRSKRWFYYCFLLLPFAVLIFYGYFVKGLPFYAIRQCLPYLSGDQPFHSSFRDSILSFMKFCFVNWQSYWSHQWLGGLTVLSLIALIVLFKKRLLDSIQQKQILVVLGVLGIFIFLNLHEFFLSGVTYRAQWSRPLQILAVFFIIGMATQKFPGWIAVSVCLFIMVLAGEAHLTRVNFIHQVKKPWQYIPLKEGGIYIGNDPPWLATVLQTTEFLKENLKEDETFLALVYEPLYYFFTGKDSPSRLLIFFNHIHIHPDQEVEIITQMETRRVPLVLISNRYQTHEPVFGNFGQTNCPSLSAYLNKYYQTVATFGQWEQSAEWFANHGVKILKKI